FCLLTHSSHLLLSLYSLFSFFFSRYSAHLDLHSFPYTTLFRSFDDQDRVFRRQADDRDQADLEVDVIRHAAQRRPQQRGMPNDVDRKSTRLNSSHRTISYAVFCLKKKKKEKV